MRSIASSSALDELVEADVGGLAGHRKERRLRQPRRGVDLEHLRLALVRQHDVRAREALAAEHLPGRAGRLTAAASSSESSGGQRYSVRPIS